MEHLKKISVLLITLLLIAVKSYAVCDFTISKTTVCAGEEVTIQLAQPISTYHNIIVYSGTFPFGSVANSNDYTLISPYTLSDKTVKIKFRGRTTATTYTIFLAEDNNNTNPQIPCSGKSVKITVNPSPDPEISNTNNFTFCNANGTTNVVISNISNTKSNNTNYSINWGDGSAVVNDPTFSSTLSHNYAVGNYKLTVTVTSNFPAPCNIASKDYFIKVGSQSPVYAQIGQNNLTCAPLDYSVRFNLDTMNFYNPANTSWKIYINGELDTTFFQSNLPVEYKYHFEKGSCGFTSKDCGSSDVDKFSFRIVGNFGNGACAEYSSNNCIPIKDSIKPYIEGKDTVCVNESTTYKNGDPNSQTIFENTNKCTVKPNRIWDVVPNANFTQTPALGAVTKNDLNITFTDTGHYRIKMKVFGDCNDKDTFKDIVVVEKVKALAAFTAPPCIDEAIGYVDVPISNLSTKRPSARGYTWSVTPTTGTSFSTGNATSDSVTIRFTRSGTYTVHLVVDGACNPATWDSTIIIKGKPAIDTLRIPEGCSVPYTFNPKDYFSYTNGGDPAATFNWVFPSGTPASANTENPGNITYNTAGTFPIGLHIIAQCGDSTFTNFVTVNNNIKPNAGPDVNVCKFSGPITLTATPTGGVWRGNGIVDSVLGIFRSSTVPTGSYNIVYVLNPTGNCPTYDTIKVNVIEIVGLTAGPDQSICKGSGTLKLNGNPAFPNGIWFGNGVVNATQGIFDPTGLIPGNYQVGYIYGEPTGACSDTAYKKITVFDSVHVSTPPNLCINQSYDFGNIIGNLSSARWNFGDNTPDDFTIAPTHTFTSAQNFIVTLYARTLDGCLDTIKIPVSVKTNPPLRFIITPDSSCTGNNISFTFPAGHDTATNYFWSFGASNVTTTLPTPQVYSFPVPILKDSLYYITLRADYFCGPSFYTDTLKVKATPVADFGIQSVGCSPFTPVLANTSYGSPTTFLWNFGNGQTTTAQNPTAPTYINTTRRDTTYKISLFVSNACGTDTITKSITVKGNDVYANYFSDINQGCQPLNINFFNLSSPGADIIWDFGDGTSAYADNVSHVYDSSGIYKAKIYARGACGIDSFTTTINVFSKPKPAFTYTPACKDAPMQFINNTTNGNSYIWYFGDGDTSISTKPNPTHTYISTGVYTVKLIVANSRPCVDSVSIKISVSTKPKAAFTVAIPKVCEQEPSVFINNSTDYTSSFWSFGNGETSTQNAPTYTYPSSGLYNVSLTAINGGCRDSVTHLAAVEIYPKPIASFLWEFTGNGFNAPVEFTNTTSNGNTFFWQFGDGDTSDLKDPGSHQYTGEGPYRVTLYTISNKGCKDTTSEALGVDYAGQVYVPNVLSPEVGIGESAIFKPKGLAMREYHLEIFSTYGELLWESTALENGQPAEGWNGRKNNTGPILPQDVYVWKIRAIFTNGKAWEGMKDSKTGKKATMGSIILLR